MMTMTYEAMGMAATLPGIVRAIEALQELETTIRTALTELQNGSPAHKTHRAPKAVPQIALADPKEGRGSNSSGYWARLTPAQRSKEMKRRLAISVKRKVAENLGYISMHGLKRGTKTYREADAHNKRIQRATKKATSQPKPRKNTAQIGWDRMNYRERKERIAKMLAGKAAKQAALLNGEAQTA